MSTYILMKLLESAPSRYDRGIRLLIGRRLDKAYDRLTSKIKEKDKVLDIGCGTGALSLRAAKRGAVVKGIDINSRMLEIAQSRAKKENLSYGIEFSEMGVAELGEEKEESFDLVMSGLCFSELTKEELQFTLKEIRRLLKPEGLLLVIDEVKPRKIIKRILIWLPRIFFKAFVYLLTQSTTTAIKNLPEKIKESGLRLEEVRLNKWDNFMELMARKPKEEE
jgi:ubiquinone/menaquinone biosynthesis C-methylase UbiE